MELSESDFGWMGEDDQRVVREAVAAVVALWRDRWEIDTGAAINLGRTPRGVKMLLISVQEDEIP